MNRLIWIAATGGGLGLSPVASGTLGALPGLVLVIAFGAAGAGWIAQAVTAVVLTVLAIPVCTAAEEAFGVKDDRRIVADEYATFPICTIGLPWAQAPWLLALAFVTNRVMDIIKPPPARALQALKGGVGIVLDDTFSSLYALAVNHAVWWAWQRFAAA